MIILSASEVSRLLPMENAIKIVRETMIPVAAGKTNLPLRQAIGVGGQNKLGIMPGSMGEGEVFGVKLLSLFPGNPAVGLSSHLGAMILFDPISGEPTAMMSADALTAVRTAAASAAATDALAQPDATCLTIIGTGEQAEAHVQSISCVRPIRKINIVGRDLAKTQAFVARIAVGYPDIQFTAGVDGQAAVKDAEIVVTATSAAQPVLFGEWLTPGCHVNAVGASMPLVQEIDQSVLTASEIFVDYRPSAFAQAREIIDALESGVISKADILAEIGDVYSGAHKGRGSASSITLYRSLGVAAQDLACAEYVMHQAQKQKIGIEASVT